MFIAESLTHIIQYLSYLAMSILETAKVLYRNVMYNDIDAQLSVEFLGHEYMSLSRTVLVLIKSTHTNDW